MSVVAPNSTTLPRSTVPAIIIATLPKGYFKHDLEYLFCIVAAGSAGLNACGNCVRVNEITLELSKVKRIASISAAAMLLLSVNAVSAADWGSYDPSTQLNRDREEMERQRVW